MRKLILSIIIALTPLLSFAATPTPTGLEGRPPGLVNAFHSTLVTVAATAVPTAYGTSFVTNYGTPKPLIMVDLVNDLDCGVTISMSGGESDTFFLPSKSTLSVPYGTFGLKTKSVISGKSAAACSSGSFYISAVY